MTPDPGEMRDVGPKRFTLILNNEQLFGHTLEENRGSFVIRNIRHGSAIVRGSIPKDIDISGSITPHDEAQGPKQPYPPRA